MQKNYGVKFVGIGGALPSKVVKNTDLEKLFDTNDEWIFSRTGIRERRVIDKEKNESGLSLSVQAAKQAVSMARINPQDIDLIIVCTSTPDKLYPSMSCLLQGEIGATKACSYDLSAACSGFIYGVITGSQFIYTGEYKNILVVGVDIHSRFMDWSERSVAILFGDGAACVLLSSCLPRDDELIGYLMYSRADTKLDLVLDNKNVFYPEWKKSIEPNFTKMSGKIIYQFALEVVPKISLNLLDKVNLKTKDIDYYIPHQANERIIQATASKIGFTNEQIISNIEKVGNTSGASIPLAILDGLTSKKIKTPSKMLLVGFGAGLTWGAAIVNWNLKV